MSTIRQQIIYQLQAHGGQIAGTCSLYRLIPADEHHIRRGLEALRTAGQIRSIRTRGGRGNKSIHILRRVK